MGCCLAGSSYSAFIESFAVDCTSRCGDGKLKRGGGRERKRKRLNEGMKKQGCNSRWKEVSQGRYASGAQVQRSEMCCKRWREHVKILKNKETKDRRQEGTTKTNGFKFSWPTWLMETGGSYWKESAANNLPRLPCQVHIHSQQGSHCNRTTLLTSPWEAGEEIVNLFSKPTQEECQLTQCAFITFSSCYFSHLLFSSLSSLFLSYSSHPPFFFPASRPHISPPPCFVSQCRHAALSRD